MLVERTADGALQVRVGLAELGAGLGVIQVERLDAAHRVDEPEKIYAPSLVRTFGHPQRLLGLRDVRGDRQSMLRLGRVHPHEGLLDLAPDAVLQAAEIGLRRGEARLHLRRARILLR